MQVHIQNDGPVTIELESPAPGAANSDPKQVSLKSGDGIRLMGVSNVPWLRLGLCSNPHLEVEEIPHGCSLKLILILLFSRMCVYTVTPEHVAGLTMKRKCFWKGLVLPFRLSLD